ncbi:hypothetical protein DL98DRAFT_505979 [Cadophora sp. DSE1049]|nr:hypothetical protein DL98DRAFT_505979 [Cadophora sp. DSE1049]
MYPCQLGLSSSQYKYDWLSMTFIDEDTSHCSMALIASINEFFVEGGISSAKALSHLSNTLALVERRMHGAEALSDSTLCMVMMLILQEQLRHEKASQIHYQGLRRMIQLRGGLSQLESNPSLLLKMSKMDVLYALKYGRPLLYFRDSMSEVRKTLASAGLVLCNATTNKGRQENGIDTNLEQVLLDVLSMTALFNNLSSGQAIDLTTFLEMVISICCRLLRFRPLQSPKPECKREAAYHIGLITFMTTLLLQWDNRRSQQYTLVSQRIEEVLNELESVEDELLLWLLFVASLWYPITTSHWLVLRIKNLAEQLSIAKWSSVRKYICRYPWIHALHDQRGYAVWNLVCQEKHRLEG